MPRQKELDREIARLTCRFKSIDEVDCIYLIPYVDSAGRSIYDLKVVVTTKEYRELIDEIVKEYNQKNSDRDMFRQYGGVLTVKTDKPDNYSTQIDEYSSKEELAAGMDIISSKVLYDKYGFYTRVAHQFDKKDDSNEFKLKKYTNTIEFDFNKKLLLEFEPKNNQ
jgi:hypothetical protein